MSNWLLILGRIFYAIGLIGIGIQHFIFRDFIPVIVPYWPAWIPGRPIWACVAGAALVAAGLAILFGVKSRTVSAILGVALLLLTLGAQAPLQLAASPLHLGVWVNAFKELALCGGAWVVAELIRDQPSKLPRYLEAIMPLGRYFLPLTMVIFGIDHFLYIPFVTPIIPAWIPGHIFWAYFAGVALIAGGAAMIVNVQGRLAALLSGIMIFLWFIMLHIPRAIADPRTGLGNEVTSVFESLAFSGIAFMIAAAYADQEIDFVSGVKSLDSAQSPSHSNPYLLRRACLGNCEFFQSR
jgi:uncharacterized membrane protein